MTRWALVCVLSASFAWAQTGNSGSTALANGQPAQAEPSAPASATQPADTSTVVPPNAPVITLPGLCDYASTGKFTDPKCTTVVTRAEFDLLLNLSRPGTPPRRAGDLVQTYVDLLVKSQAALQMGLEKWPTFDSRVDMLRLLFYAKTLERVLEEQEWKKVTDKQIEDYFNNNPQEYVIANVERIFLPRFPPDEKPGEHLSPAEKQTRQREWDKALKEKADSLRARAVAGEPFLKLQNEAYAFTGVTEVKGPEDVALNGVRRMMFDPDQKSVMDLKPGETSQPLYDETRGYCIFRVNSKRMSTLDNARGEIHKMFQTEAIKRDMDAIQNAATVTYNEAYIGPPSPDEKAASASSAPPATNQQQPASK